MKKLNSLLLFIVFIATVQLQAQSKGTVGFSFSGINSNAMLQSAALNHDYTTVKGKGFISFGLDYWYPMTDWLSLESGINYSLQNFSELFYNPNMNYLTAPEPVRKDINLVNVPVGFRVNFLKYGFVNTGLLMDLAPEAGIGSYFGVGAKIESEVGLGLMINPYVKMHSILPVSFNANADRILEAGVKIGITYSVDYFLKNRR